MKSVLESTIDGALRLQELATSDQMPLSSKMMQRLLFLAQITFAERYQGRKLMPAHFVVRHGQPVEPNVRRCFAQGHPLLGRSVIPGHVEIFFDELWQKHQEISLSGIEQALLANAIYQAIVAKGEGTEITFAMMRQIAETEVADTDIIDKQNSRALTSKVTRGALTNPAPKSGVLSTIANKGKEITEDGRLVEPWRPRVSSAQKHFHIETIERKE